MDNPGLELLTKASEYFISGSDVVSALLSAAEQVEHARNVANLPWYDSWIAFDMFHAEAGSPHSLREWELSHYRSRVLFTFDKAIERAQRNV